MWNAIVRLLDKISRDEILTQAAALAFYTALSLAPLLILHLTFLSSLNIGMKEELIIQARDLVGPEAAKVLTTIINSAEARRDLTTMAGWIGVITLGISASATFGQLQSALNTIFGYPSQAQKEMSWWNYVRVFFIRRLISFGMVLTFVFVSIVSLLVSSALSAFVDQQQAWSRFASAIINVSVFAILFSAIFRWMPDRQTSFKAAFRGGVITAVLFVVGKSLIGLYIGQAAIGSAYGAAGSFIVLLVWVYYSSLIIFLGAEISAFLTRYGGVRHVKRAAA